MLMVVLVGAADADKDKYAFIGANVTHANKDEYAGNSFGAADSFHGSGHACTLGADEDEYASGSFGAADCFGSRGSIGTIGVYKNKDVGGGFDSATVCKVNGSAEK